MLFQKLKDAKKNPVFMLKHIKDIKSPIAVAQQKHAARKGADPTSSSTNANRPSPGHAHNRSVTVRPTKFNATSPPLNTATGAQSHGWPELMSPAVDQKDKMDELGAGGSVSVADENVHASGGFQTGRQESTVQATNVSYAVAIYPYMAEQEDEFDVVV